MLVPGVVFSLTIVPRDASAQHPSTVATVNAWLFAAIPRLSAGQQRDGRGTIPLDTLERWIARASNAGRWGRDDALGTLNLITPAQRLQAFATIRDGITVSLAHEITPGPNPRAARPISLAYSMATFDSIVTGGSTRRG